MPGDKFIVYNAFSGTGVDSHTTGLFVKDSHSDDGGTCSLGIQVGAALTNTLLSFVFAVSIIVLTALGKDNISTYGGYDGVDDLDGEILCDCTLFTPSLSYSLAVSLFTEIALMAILIIFAVILTILGDIEYSKPFVYYARVTGTFIALNFFAFLCMTLAMMALASMGTSSCCSGSSMLVARLSSFLLVVKVLFIIILYHTRC